ncbi:MAG TPA: rod shape-determining protein RodA [Candidatus Choladousia intestinavium]|uniref:Rod shape-determining protein RodA n=1 Tax=Candidatus Choladousia intestinavium TaxID=2840727 RepID=A0A9D1AA34_9FIRM|nr:rod shape-determining protein RodA [Candidatus Choladousia intestinavium]
MLRQYKLSDYRFRLVLWVAALSILGILVIGSANQSYQRQQIAGMILGIVVMVIVSLFDYKWVLNFYWLIYLAAAVLLLLVLLVGVEANGAVRWLNIAGFQFQPSDIAKIMLILFFARFFENRIDKLNKPRTVLFAVLLIGIQLFLIIREPNLSTTIIVAVVFCVLYFMAGLSYKIIAGILLVCIPVAVIGVSVLMQPQSDQSLLENYQLTRIYAWLYPEDYPSESFQQQNSIVAIGSGQLYGKGLNNDDVSSVKNGNFISFPQSDFIFSVVGEELGFIGCCIIVLLEFLIALECLMVGRRARELSGTLICTGMAALVFFQSFLNISVTTGLLPNTGITLPFVSYGLTSLVSFYIGIGFVLNVGLQTKKY